MSKSKLTRGLRDQIAIELRNDIVGGHFAPGDPLVERQVAQRFGVSHAPVREALLQLAQEGLLIAHTNRGVQVAPEVPLPIRQLFQPIRQTLEVFALQAVFDQLDAEDFLAWEEVLVRMQAACRQNDVPAIAQQDFNFHQLIVERAGQCDVLSAWRMTIARARLDARHKLPYNADASEMYRHHVEIVEKCRAGEKDAALRALENNIFAEINTSAADE